MRAKILLDEKDLYLFDIIKENPNICIGELRNKRKIGITTHANMIPHLRRLENLGLIIRTRKQQSIHLNINGDEDTKNFIKIMDRLVEKEYCCPNCWSKVTKASLKHIREAELNVKTVDGYYDCGDCGTIFTNEKKLLNRLMCKKLNNSTREETYILA